MNIFNIDKSETEKIFYLRKDRGDRIIPFLPAFDEDGKFHFWVIKDNKLIEMSEGMIMVEADYFSKKKMSEDDVYINFIDFLYQKVTDDKIFPVYNYIRNDIHNLANCLTKIELYFKYRKEYEIRRFIITEIEYIFYVCRSMYDLIQKILKLIWDNHRKNFKIKNSKELKDSFADMTLKAESLRDKNELINKYKIPECWADYYIQEGPFFKLMRCFRNKTDHYGATLYLIFTEPNIAILKSFGPFNSLGIWNEKFFINDNLAPLKPILAYIIKRTLNTFDFFLNKTKDDITFLENIAPDYKLFIRGPYIKKLYNLDNMINEDVWYS